MTREGLQRALDNAIDTTRDVRNLNSLGEYAPIEPPDRGYDRHAEAWRLWREAKTAYVAERPELLAVWNDVLRHANKDDNYSAGWDWIAECKDTHDAISELEEHSITTLDDAIQHFGVSAGILKSREQDALNA